MNIRELGRIPVSDINPVGEEIRYDPLFEVLQAEIDSKPSADTGGTNWKKVVDTAANILETKSKDILVVSYLAVGLLRTSGVPEGLLNGIIIFRDLFDLYWEGMYPSLKRMRGRVQAIGWWVERTEEYLGSITELQPVPSAVIEEITSALDSLYDLISEKCPDAPSLRRILEFVKSMPVEAAESDKDVEETPLPEPAPPLMPPPGNESSVLPSQSPQTAASAQKDAMFSQAAIKNMDDASKLLSLVFEKNYILVDYLLAETTPEPSLFHLNLVSAWFDIRKLPPATDNKTLIPAPDHQILNTLSSLKDAGNWIEVVKTASYMIRRYPFWLDMNRFAAEALGMMGENLTECKNAVEHYTSGFVRRFSGIENYTFNDGTPFADNQTLCWLRSMVGANAAPQELVTTGGDELAVKIAEEFNRCRELFSNGKQKEGLAVMQNSLQSSRSVRERYLWRLSLLQLLTVSGMEKLAVPHITELLKDYDLFHLEEWDPDMALHTLKSVWNVLRTHNDPESKQKADDIIARISRISPSEAYTLISLL